MKYCISLEYGKAEKFSLLRGHPATADQSEEWVSESDIVLPKFSFVSCLFALILCKIGNRMNSPVHYWATLQGEGGNQTLKL